MLTACFDSRQHGFLTNTEYAIVYALPDGGLFCSGHNQGGSGGVHRYIPAGTDIGLIDVNQIRERCKRPVSGIDTKMTSSKAIDRAMARPNVIVSK